MLKQINELISIGDSIELALWLICGILILQLGVLALKRDHRYKQLKDED